ncbi:hypothetical protein Salat_0948300 [Sesamum alatum]|uniref:Uncharacterized protein n=1 Tax=Sesamum alatum TaxID=300844 RepID=A0AAE1YKR5_9LAMI|nr:hypothetical protein Salat_0948300 [Sesamum alatum]
MSRDNWERLVTAVLRREQLRQLFLDHSRSPSITSISSNDPELTSDDAALNEAVKMAESVIANGIPLLHRVLNDYNWLLEEVGRIEGQLVYIQAYLDDAEPDKVAGLGAAMTRLLKYSMDLTDDMLEFWETYLVKLIISHRFDGFLKRTIYVMRYSRARSKLSGQIEKIRGTVQKIDDKMKIG